MKQLSQLSRPGLGAWVCLLRKHLHFRFPYLVNHSRLRPPSVGCSAIYPTVASRSTQSLSFPPCANTANTNAGNACNATLVEPQHGLIDREKCSKKYCSPCIVSESEGDKRWNIRRLISTAVSSVEDLPRYEFDFKSSLQEIH